jgi:hypothetical protein
MLPTKADHKAAGMLLGKHVLDISDAEATVCLRVMRAYAWTAKDVVTEQEVQVVRETFQRVAVPALDHDPRGGNPYDVGTQDPAKS